MNIATIGLDVAKNVFQIHGIRRAKWPDPARGGSQGCEVMEGSDANSTQRERFEGEVDTCGWQNGERRGEQENRISYCEIPE
jgi:hypothetical protein